MWGKPSGSETDLPRLKKKQTFGRAKRHLLESVQSDVRMILLKSKIH